MVKLKPSLSLYDIYGPGYVYTSRASYNNMQWLPNSISLDAASGILLSIAGEMPFVCHHGVTDPHCLDFLTATGLSIAQNRFIYHDQKGYEELLNKLEGNTEKMVLNFPHLAKELDFSRYWVDPQLLFYLNNKGNLKEVVPEQHLPQRKVLGISDFLNDEKSPFAFPFVVKAATDEPVGGGLEVVICKNEEDLQYAKKLFDRCDFIVIEDYIPIKENYCIQFAQTYKGNLVYLGASEQIINEEGTYKGNWLEEVEEHQPPKQVTYLAKQVMEKAVSLGYWGIAGFDIVISEDGKIFVIDLNFRMNGSTTALLLKDSIIKAYNVSTIKVLSYKTSVDFSRFEGIIEQMVDQKKLVPECVYKPNNVTSEHPIILFCLLLGHSKEEINQTEEEIRRRLSG